MADLPPNRRETWTPSGTNVDLIAAAKNVREQHLSAFQPEVQLTIELLNFYIDAFNSISTYTATETHDAKLMMLALCSRSFNTALSARELILDGYYPQAIMLLRHLAEDWLTAHQIAFDPTVRKELASGCRVKTFQQMANDRGPSTGQWWRETYGMDSEISHPRMKALAIQLTGDYVRVGPVFDKELALYTFVRLLLGAARMAEPLAQTIDQIHERQPIGKGKSYQAHCGRNRKVVRPDFPRGR